MMNKKRSQQVAFILFRLLGVFVVALLIWILGFIVYQGAGALSWEFLTTGPTDGMTGGGIYPAIIGTLCLVMGSLIISFPLGVMAGIYT